MRLVVLIAATTACRGERPPPPPQAPVAGDPCAAAVADFTGHRLLAAAATLSRHELVARCSEAQRAAVTAVAVAMIDDDTVVARHGTTLTRAAIATEVLTAVTAQPLGLIVEPGRELEGWKAAALEAENTIARLRWHAWAEHRPEPAREVAAERAEVAAIERAAPGALLEQRADLLRMRMDARCLASGGYCMHDPELFEQRPPHPEGRELARCRDLVQHSAIVNACLAAGDRLHVTVVCDELCSRETRVPDRRVAACLASALAILAVPAGHYRFDVDLVGPDHGE